ncbi:hypothetical protein N9S62_02395 [Pelagibacteraceae bacterium]|nr:hypothetical protein [Pelagibacteraceae bacterium]
MPLQSTILYKNLQKRYSRRINLDLSRIQKVLKKINSPHLDLINPINVLGSDGKMSILTSLKYFFEADKKKVNAFTSPHLYDLRHRFFLKNKFITCAQIKYFTKIVENTKIKLTLFELLTCVYILAAKKQKNISYNLIESGLLFQKDSTNLWRNPRAQIVSNINFQHKEWINPKTLYEICRQKVGFLRNNTVIYINKQKPSTLKIIKKILKKNKSKIIYPENWKILKVSNRFIYKDKKNYIPINTTNIFSEGLINNVGLAIKIALDFGVKKGTITKTIPKIKFEGRLNYLKTGKLRKYLHKKESLLIDGCHSIASAKNLNNYLKTIKEPIYGIWGMQKNKMPKKFIKVFEKTFKKLITITIPNEPNAISAIKLTSFSNKKKTIPAKNIYKALEFISNKQTKTIVVFGSLYLVGDVLSKN